MFKYRKQFGFAPSFNNGGKKHSSLNLRNDMHFTFSKPSQSEDHRTFVLSDDLDAGA